MFVCLALLATVVKFSWFFYQGFYAGFPCLWPSNVLDAGTAGVVHRMQVVLASYTLVVSFLMHALQMLSFLDFYLIHVCMLSCGLFTVTLMHASLSFHHFAWSFLLHLCVLRVRRRRLQHPTLDAMCSGVQHHALFQLALCLCMFPDFLWLFTLIALLDIHALYCNAFASHPYI